MSDIITKCNPADYQTQAAFMHACVSELQGNGKPHDVAVAACLNIWRNGKSAGDIKHRELRVMVKEIDAAKRILRFIATDETEDRDGDILHADGWETANYLKNPVFLWAHEYHTLTVGKCVSLFHDTALKALIFDIQFPTPEEISSTPDNPAEHVKFCDTLYLMYRGGYINAVSVGLKPKAWQPRTDENGKQLGGNDITKQELLELSAVPVPSNPNALRLAALEKSIDKKSLQLIEQAVGGKTMPDNNTQEKGMSKRTKEALAAISGHLAKCNKALAKSHDLHKQASESHAEASLHHNNAIEAIKALVESGSSGDGDEPADDDSGGEKPEKDALDIATFKSFLNGGKE